MSYFIHKPTGILKDYIKFISVLEVSEPYSDCEKLPPTGCVEITIIPGDKLSIKGKKNKSELVSDGFVGGQKTTYSQFIPGCKEVISLLLYPETAGVVLGIPAGELSDCYITPEDIWKKEGRNLTDKISETTSNCERIKILEDFVFCRIKKNYTEYDERLAKSIQILSKSGGQTKIDKLAENVCLSKRQLERLFKTKVGLSPKEFSRILRFQHTLFLRQKNRNLSLTELAIMAGYFDQSHFICDFKQISGYNPGKYFSFGEVISDYYSF